MLLFGAHVRPRRWGSTQLEECVLSIAVRLQHEKSQHSLRIFCENSLHLDSRGGPGNGALFSTDFCLIVSSLTWRSDTGGLDGCNAKRMNMIARVVPQTVAFCTLGRRPCENDRPNAQKYGTPFTCLPHEPHAAWRADVMTMPRDKEHRKLQRQHNHGATPHPAIPSGFGGLWDFNWPEFRVKRNTISN